MKINFKKIALLSLSFLSASAFAVSSEAQKAADLAGVASNGVALFSGINSATIALFYLVGVVVFGGGCYLLYKEQGEQGRGHAKKGAVGMLVGAALLALPTMIGLTATSVAGSNSIKGAEKCVGVECML